MDSQDAPVLTYVWVLKRCVGSLVHTLSPSSPMTLLQMFISGSNGLLAITISPLKRKTQQSFTLHRSVDIQSLVLITASEMYICNKDVINYRLKSIKNESITLATINPTYFTLIVFYNSNRVVAEKSESCVGTVMVIISPEQVLLFENLL